MRFFFDIDDMDSIANTIDKLVNVKAGGELVFLCIGTEKVIGDSFGPTVGYMLNEKYNNVYGTLYNTVNATNIDDVVNEIYSNFKSPFVIVLDSALGDKEIVNKIAIGSGGIKPGSALEKDIDKIGDMYISAVVGKNGSSNFKELKNVSISNILKMSKSVFTAIESSINV